MVMPEGIWPPHLSSEQAESNMHGLCGPGQDASSTEAISCMLVVEGACWFVLSGDR
jgi:hypothetical protein